MVEGKQQQSQWYVSVLCPPCCSFRDVILLSSSSMKPSSTDSLSASSPSASVGRKTWIWVRAAAPMAPAEEEEEGAVMDGRWPPLRTHGFPTTDRSSAPPPPPPQECEQVRCCGARGRRSPPSCALRPGLCEWRRTGLGLELGWMGWEKWM